MRFPEFRGEWRESTIGKEFELYSGNTPSRLDKENFVGEINWITSGELKDHYIGESKEKISKQSVIENNLKLLDVGTFVMAIYGLEAEGIRATCSITTKQSTISQACMALSSKGNISNEFLYSWYKKHGNVIGIKYAQGTKQQNLSYDVIEKFKIHYPSTREQEKLCAFVSLLDNRIATQIGAIEKMESLIKGLVDTLFENGKWQRVQVGDFMELYPTNSLSWEQLQYESGTIRNLHYGIIHDTRNTGISSETLPFISSGFEPNKFTLCMDGDVALADASEDTTDVGKTVELKGVGDYPVVCGLHTIHGRDIKGLTIPGFKGFAMNSKYFHAQLQRLAQGSKVFSINTDNVKSCYLYIPSVNEQKQLVSLSQKLEDKLSIERHLLELYRQQKQYLLRNMFV